jgi:hypothetical protein
MLQVSSLLLRRQTRFRRLLCAACVPVVVLIVTALAFLRPPYSIDSLSTSDALRLLSNAGRRLDYRLVHGLSFEDGRTARIFKSKRNRRGLYNTVETAQLRSGLFNPLFLELPGSSQHDFAIVTRLNQTGEEINGRAYLRGREAAFFGNVTQDEATGDPKMILSSWNRTLVDDIVGPEHHCKSAPHIDDFIGPEVSRYLVVAES